MIVYARYVTQKCGAAIIIFDATRVALRAKQKNEQINVIDVSRCHKDEPTTKDGTQQIRIGTCFSYDMLIQS